MESEGEERLQERFADGALSGEGPMRDGKRHGAWRFFYRNGQLKAEGRYARGELDGEWAWWREACAGPYYLHRDACTIASTLSIA